MKLYRKEYVIGIYTRDEYETLITVVDNIGEFAEFMETSYASANMILNRAWHNELEFIRWNGHSCKIEFIKEELDSEF